MSENNKTDISKVVKLSSSIVNGLVTFVTNLFLPRVLSITEYGVFDFLQTFFTNTINILDSGSSTYFYTRLVRKNYNIGYYLYYMIFIFVTLFILGTLFWGFNLFKNINTTIYIVYLSVVQTFLYWLINIFQKFYDSISFTAYSETIFSVIKIINLLLLLYLFSINIKGLGINLARDIIFILLMFIISILIYKHSSYFIKINFKKIKFNDYIDLFNYTKPLFITSIFNSILLIWEKSLLISNTDIKQIAIFSVSYKFMLFGTFLTVSLSQLYFKEITYLLDCDNSSELVSNFINKRVYKLYILSAIISCILFFQASNIINLLYPVEYINSANVLRLLSIYPIFHVYGQIGNGIFLVNGNTKYYSKLTITAFISGIVFIYLFISNSFLGLGIYGLALKTVLVQIVTVFFGLKKLSKIFKFNLFALIFKLLFTLFTIFLLMFFLKLLVSLFFNNEYELFIYCTFIIGILFIKRKILFNI